MDRYSISQLHAVGYDAPVPNEYGATGSETLMVMLPGLRYTNDMPLMYYTRHLAMLRGWDVLNVNYDYRGMAGTTEQERVARLTADCRAALDAALAKGDYTRIVLAGKSLGTIAMTTLLHGGLSLPATFLWFTPVPGWPGVREAMLKVAADSVVVIGTRDHGHYDPTFLGELQTQGATIEIVEGGDHSLDVEGGVVESIGALQGVIREIQRFLAAALPVS